MPELSFSLGSRYQAGFGIVAQNASARIARVAGAGLGGKLAYWDVKTLPSNAAAANATDKKVTDPAISLQVIEQVPTKNGTPFFDLVTLHHPGLEDGYTFKLLPMIDVSRTKKIVETEVDGGPGEVVELISLKPWDVRFRGLLIDMEGHQFPVNQLKELNDLFEYNDTLRVESDLLNALGITDIYFRDFNPQFLEGYRDTIAFTLTGKSHISTELLILEGN